MTDDSQSRHPVEELAEEFAERLRNGERPTIAEYTDKYPKLATDIWAVFPAIEMIEQAGEAKRHAQADAPPEQIGEFRIVREIGRGGMGIVYEALQESLGRHVALKVLPRHVQDDPTLRERFRREAQAAARLHHTNIVPVFGVGEQDGVLYFAMQYIQGESLDRAVRLLAHRMRDDPTHVELDGDWTFHGAAHSVSGTSVHVEDSVVDAPEDSNGVPPSLSAASARRVFRAAFFKETARVGKQIAEALAFAHSRGVLHRDVKPSNVILTSEGVAWITDFGLAQVEGAKELTGTGEVVGTLRYLAPERFEGKTDAGGDVYGLGLTLYEMLTLRPAFHETNQKRLFEQVVRAEPVPPSQLNPAIPRDLETIALKCIAKQPRRRYATAQEVADDLNAYLEDRPIHARRINALEKLGRWVRRHPAAAALLFVSLLSLLAMVALGLQRSYSHRLEAKQRELDEANDKLSVANDKLTSTLDETELLRASERRHRYDHQIALASEHWQARDVEAARNLLLQCPPDLRRWEWYYLHHQFFGAKTILKHKGRATHVVFGADGSLLASAGIQFDAKLRQNVGEVVVWNVRSDKRILSKPLDKTDAVSIALSPKNDRLAALCRDRTVLIWSLATGERLARLGPYAGLPNCLRYSPDGATLAIGLFREIKLWGGAAGKQERTLAGLLSPPKALQFSRDGKSLSCVTAGKRICTWDLKTDKLVSSTLLQKRGSATRLYATAAFSADGQRVVAAGGGQVEVWRTGQVAQIPQTSTSGLFLHSVAISSDGKTFAFGGDDLVVHLVHETERVLLRGHSQAVLGLAFSPDDRSLVSASADGTVKLWDLKAHLPRARFEEKRTFTYSVLSPSLSLVAGRDGQSKVITVLRAEDGKHLMNLDDHVTPNQCLVFGPRDKRLASASREGMILVWSLESGKVVNRLSVGSDYAKCLQFSNDGRLLLAGCKDGSVHVFNLDSNKVDRVIEAHNDEVLALDVSADGRFLVTGSNDRTARVWDLEQRKLTCILTGHESSVVMAVLDADRQRVFTGGRDRTVRTWDLSAGKLLHTFHCLRTAASLNAIAVTPDGQRLMIIERGGTRSTTGERIVFSYRLTVWDLQTRQHLLSIPHKDRAYCVRIDANGERVLMVLSDRTMLLGAPR